MQSFQQMGVISLFKFEFLLRPTRDTQVVMPAVSHIAPIIFSYFYRVTAPRLASPRLLPYSVRISTTTAVFRDRASVRQFMEGKASVYALVAKDQLMSFRDLSFAACSARERAEVEASVRSQREAAEARATGDGGGRPLKLVNEHDGPRQAVAAASSLADAQMDEQWSAVRAGTVLDGLVQMPQFVFSSASAAIGVRA